MINGTCLRNAIISGANNLNNNRHHVDELNVFPVPDGDTGTNMSMTITAAVNAISEIESTNAGEIAKLTASSLLRGARGNSGVILSLLFRGFSQGLENLESVDGSDLTNALGIGVDAAYNAVMKPAEGTILTVARVAFERGKAALIIDKDPVFIWSEICKGAEQALEETPELMPLLKKAGVVDAGGKGLCLIFDGMLSVFKYGEIIEATEQTDYEEEADSFRNAAAEFDEVINFTYCTECIVGRNKDIDTKPLELKKYLETIGDCVVVVDDEEIIKVHVHTENPGKVLEHALSFGQLLTVKVENMKEQHKNAGTKNKKNSKPVEKKSLSFAEPLEDFGFVSVAAGDGLVNLFSELGCNHVVSGGQTMNPSTEDILEAVLATPAKVVYVFPNNKNIIMAAEQAVPFVKDRKIIIIPTKTIPQGISAMLAFDPEAIYEENIETMLDTISTVQTGQITFAARDSKSSGFKIKQGDNLALENGRPVFTEKDPVKAVIRLVRSMVTKDTSFVTLIYGNDITEEQAQSAYDTIRAKTDSSIDITLVNGAQPVYHFIVSVE